MALSVGEWRLLSAEEVEQIEATEEMYYYDRPGLYGHEHEGRPDLFRRWLVRHYGYPSYWRPPYPDCAGNYNTAFGYGVD